MEAEREEHGELALVETDQKLGSWLRDVRIARGFETPEFFAEAVGVSVDSVRLWEAGKHVPWWEHLAAIADALKRSQQEAVEGIWKEKVGTDCPCGCDGKMVLPDPASWPSGAVPVDFKLDQLGHARMLLILLPCKCGTNRIYLHRKQGAKPRYHRPRCLSCCHEHQVVKRISIECSGYHLPYFNRRQKFSAKSCRTIFLTRNQSLARQRRTNLSPEDIDRARRNADCSNDYYFFFDPGSETGERRCWRCVKAAKVWRRPLETVQGLEKVRIASMKQLKNAWHNHRKVAEPALRNGLNPTEQERGRQTYIELCKTGKKWPEMTIGCMHRWWGNLCKQCKHNPHAANKESQCAERNCTCKTYTATELPWAVRFGICVWCFNRDVQGTLIVTKDRAITPIRFHGPCWDEWRHATDEGRYFGPRKKYGQEASLPSYKSGNRPDEQTLRWRWLWFWQHFVGGMSYGAIAKQASFEQPDRLDPYDDVQRGVEYLINIFPESRLLAKQYRRQINTAKIVIATAKRLRRAAV